MSGAFALEAYDGSRRADYLRLLGEAWGGGAMAGEIFDWWFDGNPAGSLRSVAVREGEVVGVAGHTLARFAVGGDSVLGQFSVHAVTAESARGLGIFRALERRHEDEGSERGSAFVLAFASAPTRPLFLGPLGWTQIDRRRVWARIVPRGRKGTPLRSFADRHEEAYRGIAPMLSNHVVRSREFLAWRYASSPRGYRAVETSSGGFAVVGFTERRGRRFALLMDLVGGVSDIGGLLRAALAEARGSLALLAVPTPVLTRTRLARHGFVPTPYRLDFMGKGLAQSLDTRSSAWTVTLGDTDFF